MSDSRSDRSRFAGLWSARRRIWRSHYRGGRATGRQSARPNSDCAKPEMHRRTDGAEAESRARLLLLPGQTANAAATLRLPTALAGAAVPHAEGLAERPGAGSPCGQPARRSRHRRTVRGPGVGVLMTTWRDWAGGPQACRRACSSMGVAGRWSAARWRWWPARNGGWSWRPGRRPRR